MRKETMEDCKACGHFGRTVSYDKKPPEEIVYCCKCAHIIDDDCNSETCGMFVSSEGEI